MDTDWSRRDLLRAGATAGVVGLAGCVGKLPQSAQCMLNKPSYTFTPQTTLDSKQKINTFSRSINGRATVAHKKHDYLPKPTIASFDAETGATTIRFGGSVDANTLTDIIATPGELTVSVATADGSTIAFQSKGYRRQTRLKQRETGWSANIPLSVKEQDAFKTTLTDAGVTDAPADHPLTITYNDTVLREVTLTQAQADKFVSDDWNGSLIVTRLSKHEAVMVSARFNGGPLPTAATVDALCE